MTTWLLQNNRKHGTGWSSVFTGRFLKHLTIIMFHVNYPKT